MVLLFPAATSVVVIIHLSPAVIFPSRFSILSCSISHHSSSELETAILRDLPYPASIAWIEFVVPGDKKQRRTLLSPHICSASVVTCALKLSKNNRTHSSGPWSSFYPHQLVCQLFITIVSSQELFCQKTSTSLSHKSFSA